MKTYYSIIRYVNNSLSKENIAIGMVMLSGKKIFHKFSDGKINLIKKLNPNNYNSLTYLVKKIDSFIVDENLKNNSLFSDDVKINYDYLKRLSIYNNGFLQFDNPSYLGFSYDYSKFNEFFNTYIELTIQPSLTSSLNNQFQKTVDEIFKKPLEDRIDINYNITNDILPSIYFNYKLDGIGVNGSIYSLKAIDLNSEKNIDNVRKKIAEYESLKQRLDLFAKSKSLDVQKSKFYLVLDNYNGSISKFRDLYNAITTQNKSTSFLDVIPSSSLKDVAIKFSDPKIKKFSKFILK